MTHDSRPFISFTKFEYMQKAHLCHNILENKLLSLSRKMNSSSKSHYQTDKMVIRDQITPSKREIHDEHMLKSNRFTKFNWETSLRISQMGVSTMLSSKVGLNRKPLFTVSDNMFHNILDPKKAYEDFNLITHDHRTSCGSSHSYGCFITEQSPKNTRDLRVHFASDLIGNESTLVQEKTNVTCQKNTLNNSNYLKYNTSPVRKRKYARRNSATPAMLSRGIKKIKSSD